LAVERREKNKRYSKFDLNLGGYLEGDENSNGQVKKHKYLI